MGLLFIFVFSQNKSTMLVPDFSKQVNVTSRYGDYDGSYSVPTDGFINIKVTYENSSNSPVIKINGRRIMMTGGDTRTEYRYNGKDGILIPVKKGDVISYTSESSSYASDRFSLVFFPAR